MNSSGESAAREQWMEAAADAIHNTCGYECESSVTEKAEIIARHYAARAREEWIPVSERLPDFHERVLAIINGRGINVVNRRPGFKKGWLWSMGYATIKQTAVTHWCRIPAAPFAAKGETDSVAAQGEQHDH